MADGIIPGAALPAPPRNCSRRSVDPGDRQIRAARSAGGAPPRPITKCASAETKAILQAFADGVNAYRDTHANNLPSEFFVVGAFGSQGPGFQPQPWDAIDSLQTAKYMAWDLSGNCRQ